MYKSASRMGNLIFQLAFAIIVVSILTIAMSRLLHTTPIVEVTDSSLTSKTIVNHGLTSITFTVVNHDKNSSHEIKVEFSSHPLVYFMLGSQNLLKEDDIWYQLDTVNPDASYTQSINVGASLEQGIAKIDYRITMNFYVDGKQIYNKHFDLTVQR